MCAHLRSVRKRTRTACGRLLQRARSRRLQLTSAALPGAKAMGKEDFTKIPGGLPGVQTRGTLLYTYGVRTGRISVEKMCQLLCENPAKLYGVYPNKGVIAEGSDADIVVFDPEKRM